jgi:hypothetical protein
MSTPNHVKTSVDAFELIMNGAIESLRRDIAGAGIEIHRSCEYRIKTLTDRIGSLEGELSRAKWDRDEACRRLCEATRKVTP